MKSWTLGKINGIWIRVHWTFLLLPIWFYFSSLMAGSGVTAALLTVLFVLAIFGCVLLHELGHAMAAQQFGIPTRDITLLPIGGVAALQQMPRNPLQELWIAVAGPLVNVAIAGVLFLLIWLTPIGAAPGIGQFTFQLAVANVILVIFNMVPAFPMDGGRVLRSILAMFMDWIQATSIAVTIGKIAAVGFGILGLLSGNFLLVLVAVFIFFAAHSELMAATMYLPHQQYGVHHAGPRMQAESPWMRDPGAFDHDEPEIEDVDCTVPASLSANSVAAWLANRRADACGVVESGRVIGTITKSQLLIALSRGLGSSPIGSLLR